MIKNLLTSSALVLSFTLISFNAKAQENDINVMKQQSEVLKLNADLMHKKIDWEKEKQNNQKISGTVEKGHFSAGTNGGFLPKSGTAVQRISSSVGGRAYAPAGKN